MLQLSSEQQENHPVPIAPKVRCQPSKKPKQQLDLQFPKQPQKRQLQLDLRQPRQQPKQRYQQPQQRHHQRQFQPQQPQQRQLQLDIQQPQKRYQQLDLQQPQKRYHQLDLQPKQRQFQLDLQPKQPQQRQLQLDLQPKQPKQRQLQLDLQQPQKRQHQPSLASPLLQPNCSELTTFLSHEMSAQDVVLLTVANHGYLELLLNLYHTLQKNAPNACRNFLVLTYDRRLVHALSPYKCVRVFYVPYGSSGKVSSKAVSFKEQDWNAITRFKLLAIHKVLEHQRKVMYIDPDVAIVRSDLYAEAQKHTQSEALSIQQGSPPNEWCSGIIFAHPNCETARRIFDPSGWSESALDDEAYIRQRAIALKVSDQVRVLPFDLYPNGLVWSKHRATDQDVAKMISERKCVLFHYNHIAGLAAKVARMKLTGAYVSTMRIADVPEQFCSTLTLEDVCHSKRSCSYPPHHRGAHLEEACEYLVRETLKTQLIESELTFLPIRWTALAVENNAAVLDELKRYCVTLFRSTPHCKYWTVVQHCKGVYGSCHIQLPASTVIFMTSDPSAVFSEPKGPLASTRVSQPQIASVVPSSTITVPLVSSSHNPQIASVVPSSTITVPLVSSSHNPHSSCTSTSTTTSRDLLASFIGSISVHPLRQKMYDSFSSYDDVVIKQGDYRKTADAEEFERLMRRSKFALCPRGFGSTSFRFTEAMEFGCIPVYISDTFSLPFVDKVKAEDYCILVREQELTTLYERLKNMGDEQIQELQNNIRTLYASYFSMEGCCKTILFSYVCKSQ
jgi:hypothetical protein